MEFKDLIKLAIKEITLRTRGQRMMEMGEGGGDFPCLETLSIGTGQKYFHLQVENELWDLWRRLTFFCS